MSQTSAAVDKVGMERTLLSRDIRPITNWHMWLQLWNRVETMDEMIGLLHGGFDVSVRETNQYDEADRVCFYLNIADGWKNAEHLTSPADGNKWWPVGHDLEHNQRPHIRSCEVRQRVARKAFDMLCVRFFKSPLLENDRSRRYDDPTKEGWERDLISKKILPTLMHFFRPEPRFGNHFAVRNLPSTKERSSGVDIYALTCLFVELPPLVWKWKEVNTAAWADKVKSSEIERMKAENISGRARIEEAKSWLIDVLNSTNQLKVLDGLILKLSDTDVEKLRRIAMQTNLYSPINPVTRDRPVVTLEEACYAGSEAAWLVHRHELMTREHKGLLASVEAEREVIAARQKVVELEGKVRR